jgi:VIT1/CCC1 family predicted Fe2+/Mn2+ transporter
MADNDILIDGKAVATQDRSNVRFQKFLEASARSAAVFVASVGTSSGTPAIAADTSTRRQITIRNTGDVEVEVSPAVSFAFGAGLPLAPNEFLTTGYNGAIYARVQSGTGEIRAWSED